MRNSLLSVLAFFILACAAAARVGLFESLGFGHDDIMSLLVAQGNVVRYEQAATALMHHWVNASEWKVFLNETNDTTLTQIGSDLARHDIHPPLYFWILRWWVKAFGPDAAMYLNIPIMLITAASIFGLAKFVLRDIAVAVLAVSLWLLAPPAIRTSIAVRQYELLALVAVLIAWQTARLTSGKDNAANIALFAALCLIAILTQYAAAFIILAAICVIAICNVGLLKRAVPALVLAAGLFVLIHPEFHLQFRTIAYSPEYSQRIQTAATTLLDFYGWRRSWTTPPVAIVTIGIFIAAFAAGIYWTVKRKTNFIPVAFLALPTGIALVFYLLSLTPSHAFGDRHNSFAWPFAAILHAAIVQHLLPKFTVGAIASLAMLVGPAEAWIAQSNAPPRLPQLIGASTQIVINNPASGILPRYLHDAQDSASIYVASNLADNTKWLSDLRPGSLIILNPQYLDPNSVRSAETLVRESSNASLIFEAWTTVVFRTH